MRVVVNLFAQGPAVVASPTWLMATAPVQLSMAEMAARLTAGTSEAQATVRSRLPAGVVMVGEMLSSTVMDWVMMALLPQASARL